MKLHSALLKLKHFILNRRFDKFDVTSGLCANVHNIIHPDHEYDDEDSESALGLHLKAIAQKWPKYSGDPIFWVPAPKEGFYKGVTAKKAYEIFYNKYYAEYGMIRLELLEFMIDQTKPVAEEVKYQQAFEIFN